MSEEKQIRAEAAAFRRLYLILIVEKMFKILI